MELHFLKEELFWQGVVASVVGGVILAALVYAVRIASASLREWVKSKGANKQYLERALLSKNDVLRQEANTQILFNVLKWSIISGLLWILAGVIGGVVGPFRIVPELAAGVFLVFALRWIFIYQKLGKSEDADIQSVLIGASYRLFFNPSQGIRGSKKISFLQGGAIGEGKNNNENSWRVKDGALELIRADGGVHSRFKYNERNRTFTHTNESDTKSANQYIVPDAG